MSTTTEQRPYFCEGSEAMVALEAMIDRVGIRNVLYAIAHICNAKAEHLSSNWQDKVSAEVWTRRARFFDVQASKIPLSAD